MAWIQGKVRSLPVQCLLIDRCHVLVPDEILGAPIVGLC